MTHSKTAILVFVLFLSSIAFSESKTAGWYDQTTALYQPDSAGLPYLKPGFNGGFYTTLTTSSRVLSYGAGGGLDGATVCPGSGFALDSSVDVKWSAPGFYAKALLWELGYDNKLCIPSTSSATAGDLSVAWNKGNYDVIKEWNTCYNNFADCWNYVGTLYDKRVDVYVSGSPPNTQNHVNKKGDIGVTCWGTRTPSVSTPSGTYPGLSASDTGATSWHNSLTFSSTGTYTVRDTFEVKGCAATVRHPSCGGGQAEEIYSRTSAQSGYGAPEYYANLGSNTFTISVVNRQNSMTCGTVNPASPIDVPSGNGAIVNVTVRNNGNVANRVTGVTSTTANVIAIPFDMALCGITVPSTTPPCNLPNNGFNQNVDKGRSAHVWVWLTAPNCGATQTSYQTTLRFAFGTSATVCNAQTANCNLGVRVNGCSDGNSSVDRCEITPASTTIGFKQSEHFSLQCFNNNSVVACGPSVVWSLQNLLGVFWDQSPTGAFVGVHSPVGSTGTLNAAIGAVSCISNITVGNATASIDVKPDTAQLEVGDNQSFNTSCTSGGVPVPCSQVAWDPNTVLTNGDLSSSSDTGTNYTARQNGTDELWARADGLPGSPYDWSLITIGSGPPCVGPGCTPCTGPSCDNDGKSDSCEIRPASGVVLPGLSFTALCKDPPELCGVAYWYLDGVPWGSAGYASPYLLLTGGTHTVAVYVDNKPTSACALQFDVSSYQCIQYS